MDILIGMAIILVPALVFIAGYKLGQKKHKSIIQEEQDEKKIKDSQKIEEHFNNLMNYDVTTAYSKKVI